MQRDGAARLQPAAEPLDERGQIGARLHTVRTPAQREAPAVSGAVQHAGVHVRLLQLPPSGGESLFARPGQLVFPADETRARKPGAQFRQYFQGRREHEMQFAFARGKFPRRHLATVARDHAVHPEIAKGGGVEHGTELVGTAEAFEFAGQIFVGGKRQCPRTRSGSGQIACSPFRQKISCPAAARALANVMPSRPVEKFVSRRASSIGS